MNRWIVYAIIVITMPCMLLAAPKEAASKPKPNPQQSMDQQTQEILGQFASIVGNFGNIVQDPKNKTSVWTNISEMIAKFIRIFALAKRNKLSEYELQELKNILDAHLPELRKAIVEHAERTRARIDADVDYVIV